ncbi:MAG: Type 1 glutamine amidotransferase-like domain-containing protein [Clostridia bacterium]|nr:Type 1 glutamine amidotransferase-like domain-containing protein [Clostridia bacterium]
MKAFLTCAGFDNDNLVTIFEDLLGRGTSGLKALFIPTALDTPKAREYVPVFLEDLYKIGVDASNIDTYDLNEPFDSNKIIEYDIVFFCPGNPRYLLDKVNEMNFGKTLEYFLENGGVYIGVSAGSDIAGLNLPNNLGYLNATIECHSKEGHEPGELDTGSAPLVKLTDNQAIVIDDGRVAVVE